jgi:hypothetical protein
LARCVLLCHCFSPRDFTVQPFPILTIYEHPSI